jgi:RNA polymerase sigma factor (sigma-70 family)
MVLSLCARLLGDAQDAEDAFQATFLVLVRKAGSIRNPDALGSWLFGIASRVATQARAHASLRRRRLECLVDRSPDRFVNIGGREPVASERCWPELYEEMERLPESFRAPLILHYFQGLSTETIAQRLGCRRGTVLSRLARARLRLKKQLEQRGLTSASALALGASGLNRSIVPLPPPLLHATTRSAVSLALAGTTLKNVASSAVASLVSRTLRGQILSQLRRGTVFLVISGVAGIAFGAWQAVPITSHPSVAASTGQRALTDPRQSDGNQKSNPGGVSKAESLARKDQSIGQVELAGRVIDPYGKPVAGAKIFLGVRFGSKWPDTGQPMQALTGTEGRFRFTTETKELEPDRGFGGVPREDRVIGAIAPGFGPGWARITPGDLRREITIALRSDDVPIEGRVVNLEGRPIRGVTVEALCIGAVPDELLQKLRDNQGSPNPRLWVEMRDALILGRRGPLPSTLSDDGGRFVLRGVGRDRLVTLTLEGSGAVLTFAEILTTADNRFEPVLLPSDNSGEHKILGPRFEITAPPGRTVTGIVRDQESARPLPDVQVQPSWPGGVKTDADGRYQLTGQPKTAENGIVVELPDQPYLKVVKTLADTLGLAPVTLDVTLKKGIWIEGRLTDKNSGKPVRGVIQYYPMSNNPSLAAARDYSVLDNNVSDEAEFPTDSEGRFRAVGLPGPGLLAVRAMQPGYVTSTSVNPKLAAEVANPDIFRAYMYNFQALFPINPPKGEGAFQRDLELEPGRRQQVDVVGPDGQPLAGTFAYGLDGWSNASRSLDHSQFDYVHPKPGRPETVVVLHKQLSLGGFLDLRGDEQGPLKVRLLPTGKVIGRLVDEEGRPRPNVHLSLCYERRDSRTGDCWYELKDQKVTDPDGRFSIDGLVPGLQYQLQAIKPNERNYSLRGEGYLHSPQWTVTSGGTEDWGDIQVRK